MSGRVREGQAGGLISRRGAFVAVGGAGAAVAAGGLPVPVQAATGGDDRGLAAALEALRVAMEQGDGAALDRLLHPGLVYMHSSGFAQSKADLMRDLAGKRFFAAFTASELHLQRQGSTGLSTMLVDQVKNLPDGKTRASRIRVIYTWVHDQGRWQLLGRCSALIASPLKACPAAPVG